MRIEELKKKIELLSCGLIDSFSTPDIPGIRARIYNTASRCGKKVKIRFSNGLWEVSLAQKTRVNITPLVVFEYDLDIFYSVSILVSKQIILSATFVNLDEPSFLNASPDLTLVQSLNLLLIFTEEGLVVSRKEDDITKQEV